MRVQEGTRGRLKSAPAQRSGQVPGSGTSILEPFGDGGKVGGVRRRGRLLRQAGGGVEVLLAQVGGHA